MRRDGCAGRERWRWKGQRVSERFRLRSFISLPGATPGSRRRFAHGELIMAVTLPPPSLRRTAYYLKARDRNSYAFALISVAAGLEMEGDNVRSAGLALGGVALKPWRKIEAEKALSAKLPRTRISRSAAEILLQGAKGYEHNTFKIELAKQGVVRALTLACAGHAGGGASMMQDQRQAPKPVKQLDHRYEGIAKVTGKAKYAAEFSEPFSEG